jgi:hypothetical protein
MHSIMYKVHCISMIGFIILLSTAPLLGCTGVNSCPFQLRAVARLSAAGLSHLHDASPTPPPCCP